MTVQTIQDATYEGNETMGVNLSNPSSLITITDSNGTGTILDDESQPTISISDKSSSEGDSATYTVTIDQVSDQTVTVDYDTLESGTATSGTDYTHTGGTVTITAGNTTGTLTVNTIEDGDYEANETYSVILSNPSNATITDATGAGTITEDDSAPTISIVSSGSGNEGDSISFAVSLDKISYQTVAVDYVTASGTAIEDTDYT